MTNGRGADHEEADKAVQVPVRVFVSYAHDDSVHEDRVRDFWWFLRETGIDAYADLPAAERRQDWAEWMTQQVREAQHVLVIASPEYRRRAEGDAGPDEGRGVQWEARLIRDRFYADQKAGMQLVIPVVLPGCSAADIPLWLGRATTTHYVVSDYTTAGAEKLLRLLTGQPWEIAPPLGRPPVLPPRNPGMARTAEAGETDSLGAVTCTLPADTMAFTGRSEQLEQIKKAAITAAHAGRVVAIHAINGMPGVGKTTLAVHVAHMVAGQFRDRQLFIDLHAHTPGLQPVDPADALATLLTADGVNPSFLPSSLEERSAMWRHRLARQRVLLILDNAASAEQVTPLLPGASGCLVLVTSRRYLGDLPSALVSVSLEALPATDASTMFLSLAPQANEEAGKVAEMVELCGHLPLAISLLAGLFNRHQSWTIEYLINETKGKLLTIRAENRTVAAAFELSYQYLTDQQQSFFRHLGLHPGPDIDPYAAAALAGLSFDATVEILDGLHSDGLLAEPSPRRYRMHNLIHEYARSLAAADNFADE